MLAVASGIGRALGDKRRHVVVFRSTLVPGTVEDVLQPLVERESGKRHGKDFHLCFQPEFLREGTSIRDFDQPPFTIVGANSPEPIQALRELFAHLPCEFHVTSIRAAEMLKYACNNFHALKITFANETARLCHAMGVDPFEVMDLLCDDRQLNTSSAYLRPGFAFGGSCLPKDLRATLYFAKMHDVDIPMLAGVLASNRAHLDTAFRRIVDSRCKSVGMFGLSFKTGTDDLRESPLVALAEGLIGKGIKLSIYDPEVRLSNLLGANRRYIEEHLPHIGSMIEEDPERVMSAAEMLVVGRASSDTIALLARHVRSGQKLLDLAGMPRDALAQFEVEGLCW
jgi:GDP-mannose 6-dehydrogenase